MFKVDQSKVNKAKLVENDQANSIRWQTVERIDDELYMAICPKFKCKDYFNDFVVFKHFKVVFTQYGMQSDWVKFDEHGGFYCYLTGLKKSFLNNMSEIINPSLMDNYGILLELEMNEDSSEAIIYFPSQACANTYRISLITMLIRNANENIQFTDWEDFMKRSNFQNEMYGCSLKDHANYNRIYTNDYCLNAESDYVFYMGKHYNSKVGVETSEKIKNFQGSLHNNGFRNWLEHRVS